MGLNGDVDPIQCSEAVVALSVQWLNEHMQLGKVFTDFIEILNLLKMMIGFL